MGRKNLAVLPVMMLAACSGNYSDRYRIVAPETAFSVSGTEISFLSSDGETLTFTRDTSLAYGDFVGASSDTDDLTGIVTVYRSDDATAGIAVVTVDGALDVTTGYGRLNAVDRPTEGTATYSGSYIGVIEGLSDATQVTGDATFTVSFYDQTFEGDITNRSVALVGLPFDLNSDLALSATSLSDNGLFSGTVSAVDGDETTGTGTYEGLLAGTGGTEAVGALSVTLDSGYTESGVFAATAD